MDFPARTRYTRTINETLLFYESERVFSFPLDPANIIKAHNWGLITYSNLAARQGVTVEAVSAAFQSPDGYTLFDGKTYYVAYNDTVKSASRVRFTLMHEIGHIVLGHLAYLPQTQAFGGGLTAAQLGLLEREANCFARNSLAPAPLLECAGLTKASDIARIFGISKAAAETRLGLLPFDKKAMSNHLYIKLRNRFHETIDLHRHRAVCTNCDRLSSILFGNLCQDCGEQLAHTKRRLPQCKPDLCPRCRNEELPPGDFCPICGLKLT